MSGFRLPISRKLSKKVFLKAFVLEKIRIDSPDLLLLISNLLCMHLLFKRTVDKIA